MGMAAGRDREVKRELDMEAGVEEYWIVDLDRRLFERWRQGDVQPEVVGGEFRFAAGGSIWRSISLGYRDSAVEGLP